MIYDVIIEHFNKMIENKPVKEESLYVNSEVTYDSYLKKNFRKDMVVLFELSKIQISGVIDMITAQSESI